MPQSREERIRYRIDIRPGLADTRTLAQRVAQPACNDLSRAETDSWKGGC
jgi:hypothetical protein